MISNIKKFLLVGMIAVFSSSMHSQIHNKAEDVSPLLIGEKIPNSFLKDVNGKKIKLKNLLKDKKSILVFYRGGWCPYCNTQLAGLAKIEQQVLDLGYQIIAISPSDFRNSLPIEEKNELKYQLLSDETTEFIQKVGIAFKTPLLYKGYIPTTKHIGATPKALPVPTLMVVDTDGTILFEYINPDYRQRISSELLLSVLNVL